MRCCLVAVGVASVLVLTSCAAGSEPVNEATTLRPEVLSSEEVAELRESIVAEVEEADTLGEQTGSAQALAACLEEAG
jgi:hypothetical protein